MSNLLSSNPVSLKMLFTEDIYSIQEDNPAILKHDNPTEGDAREQNIPISNIGKPTPIFEYLGENNKYFLVLHDDKIHTRINPVHQEMLLKVMAAKKLELRDLAIVNICRYPDLKFESLKTFFSCTRVVMFGITPSDLGLDTLKFNREQSADNVRILATYSLEDMRNSPEKKREFWNIMKSF